MRNVVFGFLGSIRDAGFNAKRHERWRPTVCLCSQEAFPVHRLELFLDREQHLNIAEVVKQDILAVSPNTEINIHVFNFADSWDLAEVYTALANFAEKYDFDESDEHYVHVTTGTDMAKVALFMLAESRRIPAKVVSTLDDKTSTGVGRVRFIDLDLSQYDALVSRFSHEKQDGELLLKSGIVTRNAAFNALIAEIEHVTLHSSAPILLTGPTGAGKSQLATRIYELRLNRHLVKGNFIEVNCATLSRDNAMSALFGHVKGAFTGALTERAGYLKAADKGVLFLDELGELGLDEQAMLLRALEDKSFFPLGSDKKVKSDFQLIAGTNRDLAKEVAEGRFRSDLYARINLWSFRLLGLSERREDIEPNLDYELRRASSELNCRVSMNGEAKSTYMAFAQDYSWPGNFRDLAASVTRMSTLAAGGRVTEQEVAREIKRLRTLSQAGNQATEGVGMQRNLLSLVLPEFEADEIVRVQIEAALYAIHTTSTMAEAGRRLFAVSREKRSKANDSDRMKKFLENHDLQYGFLKAELTKKLMDSAIQ